MQVYNELFKDDSSIEKEFQLKTNYLINNNLRTLYAFYDYQDYSGEAFLVFENTKTGELFEVNGSHCSCNGLEEQFALEKTALDSIKMRKNGEAIASFILAQRLNVYKALTEIAKEKT